MQNPEIPALEKSNVVETPLMKQYYSIKSKYPDAMLLFRVGDFYETFGDDAIRASNILGIVLTRRANGSATYIELAGFPHHSLDTYLPKLVRAGMRVAICDQLEDPKLTKKIVKRGVTELISPGVSYNDKILDHKKNNFLASIHTDNKITAVAFIDISTGEFLVAEGDASYIDKLIQNFNPGEIIFSKAKKTLFTEQFANRFYNFSIDDWVFQEDYTRETLLKHFNTVTLKGFGIEHMQSGIIAAGAALHYISETRKEHLKHISGISRIEEDKYVWLDKFTIRNLEILSPSNDKGVSLVDVIDQTLTPMGGRLLRRWLLLPLKTVSSIEERQDAVNYCLHHQPFSNALTGHLRQTGDLERLISKAALGKIAPREVQQLRKSLEMIQLIRDLCLSTDNPAIRTLADQLNNCTLIRDRIARELNPEAPALINKGGVINSGFNAELDELRNIAYHGKDYLLKLQQRESERTGITSLKVGFNNVFGYFIEVTHTHKDKVPLEWTRRQTLTNAERYITDELKQYEEKILGAEEKILTLEARLFNELIEGIIEYIQPIQLNATLIARIDCLHSFAVTALRNEYVRPTVNDSFVIDIKDGRHPVIERQLLQGEKYIANNIYLNPDTQQILMITGPNMSGKSALLRQTALIALLAQTGSFVPATHAHIGIVDKIFTRVGASDNISSGESTFMVEMNETASILHNISERSLILLDEIGRGTSTYDGISIAWAIAEFLHESNTHARTLFATHYHELNEMAIDMPRIRNFHVSIKELSNNVIFLRKLVEGGSEHSFGIHVAKMAGIPAKVLTRAHQMLERLEASRSQKSSSVTSDQKMQLSFFQLDDPTLSQIKDEIINLDIENLTPVQALNKLNEIKKILGDKQL
jgi:DNA mismatch repair protein MutS